MVTSQTLPTLEEPEPGRTGVARSTGVTVSDRRRKDGLGRIRKRVGSLSADVVRAFAARPEGA